MSTFNYDFFPAATSVKPLNRSDSTMTLFSFMNGRESIASEKSCASSMLDCHSIPEEDETSEEQQEEEEQRQENVEKKEEEQQGELYVQPGLRDVKILQRYLNGQISVPEEVVLTWLPGYIRKI